jgi:glutathione peroxidase
MTSLVRSLAVAGLVAFAGAQPAAAASDTEIPMSFYDLTVHTLDGAEHPLAAYRGQVVLVVNTASECGFTPQYAGLQKLHEEYGPRGFAVLGFPSNDFGGQEPGTPAEIGDFVSSRYQVDFPVFEKVETKGDGQSPVYAFLTAGHGTPKWNFHKYLVGKDGRVVGEFPSKVTPESTTLRTAIDAELDK